MRVLIADDSTLVAERLSALVEKIRGVKVVGHTETVQEAQQAMRLLKPDVLILDLRMPGGSGINVLESLKKDRATSTVIVLTNYSFPQYRTTCLKWGARFFFDKSTEFERVAEVLQQLAGDSAKERPEGQ